MHANSKLRAHDQARAAAMKSFGAVTHARGKTYRAVAMTLSKAIKKVTREYGQTIIKCLHLLLGVEWLRGITRGITHDLRVAVDMIGQGICQESPEECQGGPCCCSEGSTQQDTQQGLAQGMDANQFAFLG